jgi:hypothetical protein
MLGWIALFAFGAILFTWLVDSEERLPLAAWASLLSSTAITGVNETWATTYALTAAASGA